MQMIHSCTFTYHLTVQLQLLLRIRRHLPKAAAVALANALVSSRLDYCNSLMTSLSCKDLHKLQCIQNSLACIVTNTPKYAHITPVLKSLHWLPVEYRCIFKTATIIYKYLHTGLPKYFSPHISLYTCSANTRHNNPRNKILTTPLYNKSIFKSKVQFNNSFSYNGPNV